MVTKREKQVGERVRGSDFSEDVILVISTLSQMEVKVEVGEHEVVFVKEGDTADVEIDALPDRKFPAQVVEVARNATVKNQGTEGEVTTFFVRLALTEPVPGALPGMSAQASIATDTRDGAVVVPIQAVTVRPESEPRRQAGRRRRGRRAAGSDRQARAAGEEAAPRALRKVVFVVDGGSRRCARSRPASRATPRSRSSRADGGREGRRGPYRVLSRELEDGKRVTEEAAGREGTEGAAGPKG